MGVRVRPRSELVMGVVFFAACITEDLPEPDACDQPNSEAVEAVEVGAGSLDSVFEPWEDGEVIDVVWGPQGGAMFRTRYRVRGSSVDCIAQRTLATDEDGEVLLEDATPLRVYGDGAGSYTTETHWLIFNSREPPRGTLMEVEVEVEIGSARDRVEVWVDSEGS